MKKQKTAPEPETTNPAMIAWFKRLSASDFGQYTIFSLMSYPLLSKLIKKHVPKSDVDLHIKELLVPFTFRWQPNDYKQKDVWENLLDYTVRHMAQLASEIDKPACMYDLQMLKDLFVQLQHLTIPKRKPIMNFLKFYQSMEEMVNEWENPKIFPAQEEAVEKFLTGLKRKNHDLFAFICNFYGIYM